MTSLVMLGVFGIIAGALVALLIVVIIRSRPKKEMPARTVTDEIKERMLPTGFYVITGRQRVGKGSLGAAIMDTDCTYHCGERLAEMQKEVERLNAVQQETPYDLHAPDFPYRSKGAMQLGPEYTETTHIDVKQFALPDGKNKVQYLPPYTMVHLEEIDAYMNCRGWTVKQEEKGNTIDLIKWIGHQNVTCIADAQVFERIDAGVRALVTDELYVINRIDTYKIVRRWFRRYRTNEVIRTEWTFYWINNQLKEQAARIKEMTGEAVQPKDYMRKCRFVYEGNIYERYNSESGKPYFYYGITDFDTEPQPSNGMTRDEITDYCERNARKPENEPKTNTETNANAK